LVTDLGNFPVIGDVDDFIGFKHGRGAVAQIDSRLYKSDFRFWANKLDNAFPFEFCGTTPSNSHSRPLNHEVSSRMHCVPKSAKAPRIIAAEPVEHQWCQQFMWSRLNKAIRSSISGKFIDFKRQDLSGELVRAASRDGELATVDLSDASDRLSCFVVERIFRSNPEILDQLHAVRTRSIRHIDGSTILLKKYASQGTAVTFPIQSLVFLCIALGCSIPDHRRASKCEIWRLIGRVRVYGDDIIIPSTGYEKLCRIMDLLQLKVNVTKSYVHGRFRESCGSDFYRGYCVTPVKPKSIASDGPTKRLALIECSNNLFKKGLWQASEKCLDLLPPWVRKNLLVVDQRSVGYFGLVSFTGGSHDHLRWRWNYGLHRYEVRAYRVTTRARTTVRSGYSLLLDFFSQHHSPLSSRVVSERGYSSESKDRLGRGRPAS
jgi:hypothetical protein